MSDGKDNTSSSSGPVSVKDRKGNRKTQPQGSGESSGPAPTQTHPTHSPKTGSNSQHDYARNADAVREGLELSAKEMIGNGASFDDYTLAASGYDVSLLAGLWENVGGILPDLTNWSRPKGKHQVPPKTPAHAIKPEQKGSKPVAGKVMTKSEKALFFANRKAKQAKGIEAPKEREEDKAVAEAELAYADRMTSLLGFGEPVQNVDSVGVYVPDELVEDYSKFIMAGMAHASASGRQVHESAIAYAQSCASKRGFDMSRHIMEAPNTVPQVRNLSESKAEDVQGHLIQPTHGKVSTGGSHPPFLGQDLRVFNYALPAQAQNSMQQSAQQPPQASNQQQSPLPQ